MIIENKVIEMIAKSIDRNDVIEFINNNPEDYKDFLRKRYNSHISFQHANDSKAVKGGD